MNIIKLIFILLGSVSLCIGVINIIIPGLPTTPFLLLSALFYLKSSDKLYNKLISNRLLGRYISDFYKRKGMTGWSKFISITSMWAMIIISGFFFLQTLSGRIIIFILGIAGSVVMGILIPTVKNRR